MFKRLISEIPIMRDILDTSYEDHRESFKEIFVTLFIINGVRAHISLI